MDYWEKNGIEKPQQIVVCAANRYGSLIICGARHHDSVMHEQIKRLGGIKKLRKLALEEQGFINQFGEFLTREQAMNVVLENGQLFNIKRNGDSDTKLFSEGLY